MMDKASIHPNDIAAAKHTINGEFPKGQFVAVEGGDILADAATHRELIEKLKTLGRSPKDLLVLQAGVDYPDSALILVNVSDLKPA